MRVKAYGCFGEAGVWLYGLKDGGKKWVGDTGEFVEIRAFLGGDFDFIG
jgi:hypothetical protein